MGCPVIDRRREQRAGNPGAAIARATLRPGCPVLIVDVSPRGALVEGSRPLRPGARVQLHLVTAAGSVLISALVLRCAVWAIGAGDGAEGVIYRGALLFDERCDRFSRE